MLEYLDDVELEALEAATGAPRASLDPRKFARFASLIARRKPKLFKRFMRKQIRRAVREVPGVLYSAHGIVVGAGGAVSSGTAMFYQTAKGNATSPVPGFAYDERFTNITTAGQMPAGVGFRASELFIGAEVLAFGSGADPAKVAGDVASLLGSLWLELKWDQAAAEPIGLASWYYLPGPVPGGAVGSLAAGAQAAAAGLARGYPAGFKFGKEGRLLRPQGNILVKGTYPAFTAASPENTKFAIYCVMRGSWLIKAGASLS